MSVKRLERSGPLYVCIIEFDNGGTQDVQRHPGGRESPRLLIDPHEYGRHREDNRVGRPPPPDLSATHAVAHLQLALKR
jgi:hypothetical protein